MNPEKFALAVGAAVFVAGSAGLILHRVLPEKHLTGGGKDMIGAVVGLLTLLSALVLGLLIWTAYGVYGGQNVAIQTLAAKVLQLDDALSDYGPEANGARAQLRQSLAKTIDEIWGSHQGNVDFVANNFAAAIQNVRNRGDVPGCAPSFDRRADTGARSGKGDGQLDRPIAIADVLRPGQSNFHSAHRHRRYMGDISLFRLRVDVGRQRCVLPRRGRRRSCGRKRRLSDP